MWLNGLQHRLLKIALSAAGRRHYVKPRLSRIRDPLKVAFYSKDHRARYWNSDGISILNG
jgi:hypothetical protein